MSDSDQILSLVRFGIGKELCLYRDTLMFRSSEERREIEFPLEYLTIISVKPGKVLPSKLVLEVTMSDGEVVTVVEGLSNIKGFLRLLDILKSLKPDLSYDPSDLPEQLSQALEIKRSSSLGCYLVIGITFLILVLIFVLVDLVIRHHL